MLERWTSSITSSIGRSSDRAMSRRASSACGTSVWITSDADAPEIAHAEVAVEIVQKHSRKAIRSAALPEGRAHETWTPA